VAVGEFYANGAKKRIGEVGKFAVLFALLIRKIAASWMLIV
jgi:hypothetical protein